MTIISIPIIDPVQWRALRQPNVGCSQVAALFGILPWTTAFELGAQKLGLLEDKHDSAILRRGRHLEPAAREELAIERPDLTLIRANHYYVDEDIRFGATPDLFVRDEHGRLGVVQIKTVGRSQYNSVWRHSDGEIEPPLYVALQAMCEQHLTGVDFALVLPYLVDEYTWECAPLIPIPYLPAVIETARGKVKAFWEMLDAGVLPPLDYARDRGALARVYAQDDGEELDLSGDNELPEIVAQLEALKMAKKTAEGGIEEAQAKILARLGTAQRARFSGGVIVAKTVKRGEYTVGATSYRTIRLKLNHPQESAA